MRRRPRGEFGAGLAAAAITAVLAIVYSVVSWSQGLWHPRVGAVAALLAATAAAGLTGATTTRERVRIALSSAAMVSCYALGAITIFSTGVPLLIAGALAADRRGRGDRPVLAGRPRDGRRRGWGNGSGDRRARFPCNTNLGNDARDDA